MGPSTPVHPSIPRVRERLDKKQVQTAALMALSSAIQTPSSKRLHNFGK